MRDVVREKEGTEELKILAVQIVLKITEKVPAVLRLNRMHAERGGVQQRIQVSNPNIAVWIQGIELCA